MQTILIIISVVVLGAVVIELFRTILLTYKAKELGKKVTPFSKINPGAEEKILVIGDSTSLGVGSENPNKSLAGRLSCDFPNASICNLSKNAMEVSTLLKELTAVSHMHYDIIMMHIGGIDTLKYTSMTKLSKNLNDIFNIAKKMNPDKIILVSMNNVGAAPVFKYSLLRPLYSSRSRKIRDFFSAECKKHEIIHADLFAEKKEDSLSRNPKKFYAADGIHPTDEGYGLWYDKIKKQIKNLI